MCCAPPAVPRHPSSISLDLEHLKRTDYSEPRVAVPSLSQLSPSSPENGSRSSLSAGAPAPPVGASYNAFWSVKIPCKQNPRDRVRTEQAAENPINKQDKFVTVERSPDGAMEAAGECVTGKEWFHGLQGKQSFHFTSKRPHNK